METKIAPKYANLTSSYPENNLYEIICKRYNNDIKTEFIRSWKRYQDVCFIFWKCPYGNINNLYNSLENIYSEIRFTMEHRFKEPPFLDILIKSQNGQIIIDISHKPTDIQRYLHFKCHHIQICIKSITFTRERRICTLLTNKNLWPTHVTLYQTRYSTSLINKRFELAEKMPLKKTMNAQKHCNEGPLT